MWAGHLEIVPAVFVCGCEWCACHHSFEVEALPRGYVMTVMGAASVDVDGEGIHWSVMVAGDA